MVGQGQGHYSHYPHYALGEVVVGLGHLRKNNRRINLTSDHENVHTLSNKLTNWRWRWWCRDVFASTRGRRGSNVAIR